MTQASSYERAARRLLRMLLLLPAAGLIGCGQADQGPVTAASSRYQVADDGAADGAPNGSPAAGETAGATAAQSARLSDQAPPPAAAGGASSAAKGTPGGQASPAAAAQSPEGQDRAKAAFDAAGELDLNKLPEDESQLLSVLQLLQVRQPRGRTEQEQLEDFIRLQHFRVKAAEKLLGVATSDQSRLGAVQTKLDAMRALTLAGAPNMDKQLTAYCQSLQQSEDPQTALLGRMMLFGLAVDDLAGGATADVPKLLEELKGLAADAQENPGAFMVVSQAAGVLQSLGQRDAAITAYRTIGESFRDNPNPQMAAEAQAMLERVRILEAGLDEKIRAMLLGEPDSDKPVMDTIAVLLEAEGAGPGTLAEMAQGAQFMEMTDRYQLADQVYLKIEESYRDHADAELAKRAVEQAQNGRKRVALVGKPLVVEGVTLDGSPFDWSAYQGKVVLVDFWATWCQPCLAEMPNIARIYREYRERGFEVVGIGLDDDVKDLQRFMEVQPLPWPTVVSPDEQGQGIANPLAVASGVDALPFVVLVGRDGNVAALHARGPRLQEKLDQLLGPAAEAVPAKAVPAEAAPPEAAPVEAAPAEAAPAKAAPAEAAPAEAAEAAPAASDAPVENAAPAADSP